MSNQNFSTDISPEIIAQLCIDKFKNLPKTGKPTEKEWTILAGIVLYNKQTEKAEVVSLGCGTKCIGRSKLCPHGLILNDSHAEVMARRGLLRYIYHQLRKSRENAKNGENLFVWSPEQRKFQLKEEYSLHFLSTQTPCGDACIIDENKNDECREEPVEKRCKKEEVKNVDTNVGCLIDSVYTGAKLIGSQHSDAMEQVIGAVRAKPGRGERTLSMSCSDKIAKWQIMGVQGALLDCLLSAPIYFDTFNFWGHKDIVTLERAIWKRFLNNDYTHDTKYKLHVPNIRICYEKEFPYAQDNTKQPSPNGLVWCNIPESIKPYEIAVNGKRQGITSKKLQTPHAALKISKYFLFREFLNLIKSIPELVDLMDAVQNKTYIDCKYLAKDYQCAWSKVKSNYFRQWTKKPDNLLKFSIEKEENKRK
ncbi:adenosine deaminase, tRNA-specific 1 [Cochliomyia hominivorax]